MRTNHISLVLISGLAISLPLACNDSSPDDGGGGVGGDTTADSDSDGFTLGGFGGDGGQPSVPGAGGTGGTAPARDPLTVCEVEGGPSVGDPLESLVLDDFDDGNSSFGGNGLAGGWYGYGDGTAGAVLTPAPAAFLPVSGGLTDSGSALHVESTGFKKWGSGFGAYLATSGQGDECLFDGSAYSGISFWARGSIEPGASAPEEEAGQLKVMLIEKDVAPVQVGGECDAGDGCWDSHRVRVELDDCWRRYSFSFDEFQADGWGASGGELDLNELYLLGFEVSQGQSFDVWLDDVQFFVGDAPPEAEQCDDGAGGAGGGGTD